MVALRVPWVQLWSDAPDGFQGGGFPP
jgi:hypothetical protein